MRHKDVEKIFRDNFLPRGKLHHYESFLLKNFFLLTFLNVRGTNYQNGVDLFLIRLLMRKNLVFKEKQSSTLAKINKRLV